MKLGITMFVTAYSIDIVTLARKAEALGIESLWVPEHPVIPVQMSTPWSGPGGVLPDYYKHTIDPFCGLAAAAAATTRLLVGTAICLVPERHPLYTAKEVATVDRISGGRFQFGVGAGWLREESELLGVDFPRRWSQTREHVLAMKACWENDTAAYHGRWVDFPELWCQPRPVQQPHPPVLIAGELEKSAERVAEWGDGWIPRARGATPEGIQAGRRRIEELMRQRGRDPGRLTVSLFAAPPDKAQLRAYGDAGCDRAIVLLPTEDEAAATARLEKLAAEVL